jgi:hypothetical protein
MTLEVIIDPNDVTGHPTGQPHVHQHAALKARQYEKTMAWQALLLPEVARRLGLSEPRADDLARQHWPRAS